MPRGLLFVGIVLAGVVVFVGEIVFLIPLARGGLALVDEDVFTLDGIVEEPFYLRF